MKKSIIFLLILSSLICAQQPPPLPLPLPGGRKKKPIDILKDVQKKMEEIGNNLSRGSLDKSSFKTKEMKTLVKKIVQTKSQQKEVISRLSNLLKDPANETKKIEKELNEIIKNQSPGNIKKKIKKWLKLNKKNIVEQEEIDRLLEKFTNIRDFQKQILRRLSELMKDTGLKQKQVEEQIEALLRQIEKQKSNVDAMDRLEKILKKQEKTVNDVERLFNSLSNKQSNVVKDIDQIIKMAKRCSSPKMSMPKKQKKQNDKKKDQLPKKPKDKQKKNKKSADNKDKDKKDKNKRQKENDNDRWGDLPPHIREYINSVRKMKLPAEYKQKILEYYRRMAETKNK